MDGTPRTVVVIAAIFGFYGLFLGRVGTWLKPWLVHQQLARRYSFAEAESVARLTASSTSQAIFCLAAMWWMGLDAGEVGVTRPAPHRLVFGAFLGLGEMVLSSLLAYAIIRLLMQLAPAHVPAELKDWLMLARAGWMRRYLTTVQITPLPIGIGLTMLFVAGEEVLFRGVVQTSLLPHGPVPAILGSTLVFVLVQAFHMPSWTSAMFPIVGALVLGLLHGVLFYVVPDLSPLIVAHLCFLFSALI